MYLPSRHSKPRLSDWDNSGGPGDGDLSGGNMVEMGIELVGFFTGDDDDWCFF
jgi:hypothetical protein